MHSHEFYNELKRLTELGYLEQAQLDRIQDEYIQTRKERGHIFLIFSLLGVIFIGAGVISLFAYNWSMFSRETKACIAFLPLLGVQAALYWKVRANASEVWIKSLTLALGIAFLSALGLIYQAYQLSYSLSSMMLAGFVLMLPVVYLLDGYYLAVLYMAGICWAGGTSHYTLPVVLLIPYYIKKVRSGGNCVLLSLCFFIWTLYLASLYIPYETYYAFLLLLLIYTTVEKPPLYRKLAGRLIYVMLFMKAAFYFFYNDLASFFEPGAYGCYFYRLSLALTAVLLVTTALRSWNFCKKNARSEALDLLCSASICGLLALDVLIRGWGIVFPYTTYEILVNLSFIAFSMHKLLRGVKLANLGSVRRYTAAIILYITLKVWLGDYQLAVKGMVFIMAGLAFLAVNYRMTMKLKEVSAHENTPE